MKVGEDRGQILAFYKTKSDMEKGKGLYLNAFAGVSPWITLLPDAQEFEVFGHTWMWEKLNFSSMVSSGQVQCPGALKDTE